MQVKALFLSAVLAFASASTASEHEHRVRSPQNDNFGRVPPNARSSNGKVVGPFPAQELLGIPQLAAQFAKRQELDQPSCIKISDCTTPGTEFEDCGPSVQCITQVSINCTITESVCPGTKAEKDVSPFVNGLDARSPHALSPSYSIATALAGKLELKDDDEHHIIARAGSKISEVIQSAMPAHVKNALINDPKAAESLDKEFSGTKVPQWYAKLPANVTNYYATITSPPTMTGSGSSGPEQSKGHEENKVDDWVAKVQSYKNKLAPELSAMSVAAVSESKEAKRLSELASKNSKAASRNHNDDLKTTAWSEAKKAATMSHDASTKSAYAASASRAVFPPKKGEKKSMGASIANKKLVLASSVVGAAVCLGFAVAL